MNEKRQLPKEWRGGKMDDSKLLAIDPKTDPPSFWQDEQEVLFVSMALIDEHHGKIKATERKTYRECRKGKTRFSNGDVLFAKITPCVENGKVALVEDLDSPVCFGSTEFYVLRPTYRLLSEFLLYYVRTSEIRDLAVASFTGTSGRQRVPSSFWSNIVIPFPPLPVQERIVEILQQADAIRRKRAEARHLADQILPALFYHLLEQNQIKITKKPLNEITLLKTGGTPSRKKAEYWSGSIPWVSPSDMKELEIFDTIEHISEDALSNSSTTIVDPGTILIVVRSGILAHTFPVAIARNRLAFNQDIKALIPNPDIILPEYLLWALNARKTEVLHRMVKHGSTVHSIDSTLFNEMLIPIPPLSFQRNFIFQAEQLLNTVEQSQKSYADANNLFASLLSKAFTGELTAEWEVENAESIAARQAFYERLPRLVLLALLAEKAQRNKTQAEILVTALMKYAFLLQMEGASRRRFYHFISYHYGPFAKELYTDLHALQKEGLVAVAEDANEDKTRITLTNPQGAQAFLQDLPDDQRELVSALRQDAATIIETYDDLNHGDLLATVYEKYPAYAKKSKLRKKSIFQQPNKEA